MKPKTITIFIISLFTLIYSCSNNDDATNSIPLEGSYLEAKIQGKSVVIKKGELGHTLNGVALGIGSEFTFTILGNIINLDRTVNLDIEFTGENFENLKAGDTFSLDTNADIGYANYSTLSDDDNDTYGSTTLNSERYIKITVIDTENRIISGEFRFSNIKDSSSDKTYTIEGSFNEVTY
ncbi:hypothetical protein [Algibacter sp. 2305UL17-15]|uniref:hypothetical protein n=1 Tax=Algibacter sp. 2305UL17-15 TaxID=3231268 RepID=UPI00345ADF0A